MRRVWMRLAAIGCGALACNGAGSFVVPETNGGAHGELADPAEGHGSRQLLPSGADSPIAPVLAPGAGGASDDGERHSGLDDGVGGAVGTGGSGAEEAAGSGGSGGTGFGGSGNADPASGEERRYALLR